MKSVREICEAAKQDGRKTIAIAGISGEEIGLVKDALADGIANFVLVDQRDIVESLLKEYGVAVGVEVEVVAVDSTHQAPRKVFELLQQGRAQLPMKGQVHTGTFLKAALDKEIGVVKGDRLSQITMFDGYNDEPQFLTDCAINICPTLEERVEILNNAIKVFSHFSGEEPRVALLGAVETVSAKMPDTQESAIITQMNRRGQIPGCVVDGPLSLDNAISEDLARIKKIDSPVVGRAQIMVSSDLREANNVSKAIIHFAKREAASIIAGTSVPVVMTSRTDLRRNKLNTIAIACYMLRKGSQILPQ